MRKNPTEWNANEPGRNWHLDVFFGLHYDLHAGVRDTELGAALTPEHLKAELEKVRPDWVQCDCKGHAGYTSWPTEVGTTSPGVVKDALRMHRDVTRALGIPLVMHYSGVWDNRALELHPDWACVGPSGEVAGKEGFVTGATCNLSAYTDELMIPQLLEVIEQYDVDGFWVDGENWATRACYCPRCTGAFTAETGIGDIPQAPDEPHWAEWAAFHRRAFEAHVRAYADAVHERKPSCLVCSNWMYTVGQPDTIKAPVDYLSGDFSWVWSTGDALLEGRFMDGRGLSWNLMAWGFTTAEPGMSGWTFKPAAMLCQEAACVISLGGAFQIYNQPQRNGHLTGWHQEVMAEVARFVRARQPWCQHTETVPQAAVLHAQSHFHAATEEVLMSKWKGVHAPVTGALHALLEDGYAVDILNEDALLGRMGDYALVVIPEQTQLPEALKAALADYVQAGGKLLLSGATVADDFAELAGVRSAGEAKDGYFYLPVGREATTVKGPRRPVALSGAEMLLPVLTQQEPALNATAEPAVTLHRAGAGLVAAVHSGLFNHFAATHYPRTRRLVGEIIDALAPDFQAELDAPARLQLVLRRKDHQLIAHLVNQGTAHPTSPSQVIIDEVPPIGPVTLRVKLSQAPARVYLAPSMEGMTWAWRDGLLTVQVQSVGIMDSVIIEE
ncbi:MAG: alpha-amylase family protein [Armatimonadota bacterium]